MSRPNAVSKNYHQNQKGLLWGDMATAFHPPWSFQLLVEGGLSNVGVWFPGALLRTRESGYLRGMGFTNDSLNPK